MSKVKDKKLKKFRKKSIFPKLLIIGLTLVGFFLVSVILIGLFIVNVIFDKVENGYNNSNNVARIIEREWDGEDYDKLDEICETIFKNVITIKDICIVSGNNEVMYQSGDVIPDFTHRVNEFGNNNIRFYIESDEESFIYVRDRKYDLRVDEVFEKIALNTEQHYSIDNFLGSRELTLIKFWYDLPVLDGTYRVCVKNELPVKDIEVLFIVVVIELLLIVAMVLIIYNVISLLGIIMENKKHIKMMTTDMITGGYNLQYYITEGNKLLKKNRKKKQEYAVVVIRMEKYRNFCSCYGVKEGEEILEEFDYAIAANMYKKEIHAHVEEADFALLMSYTSNEEIVRRMKKILYQMSLVKEKQKKYFSVGVYNVQEIIGDKNFTEDIESRYNYAVVAVNSITEDSEERIAWFNEEMKNEQLWIRMVENDMENALVNKEFQVYLQPKYSTKDEVLEGAEALVRWQHPTEGFIAPYRFVPIFENDGFVMQLDDYMLTEVSRQQAKWIAEGKRTVPISVNISRVHFINEDLAEHICQIVDEFKVPHNMIELELTESAFFDDKGVLLNTIKKLKKYGFAISMDDFGSGYSSLNSLRELPLDVVKLDAGFFKDSDENDRGKLIVGDTISLAKKLNMKIVAEGIETREQVDFLAKADCDLIQGYYFAKPMPINEFEEHHMKISHKK